MKFDNMIKHYQWILTAMAVVAFQGLFAQSTIKVEVPGTQGQDIYLANYYGNKLYYNDTTKADANGIATFQGKAFEECGKYAVVLPGPKVFDILVAEEDIHVKTSMNNPLKDLEIVKSEENKIFYDYLNFIAARKELRVPLDSCLADSLATDKDKEKCREQLTKLNEEVVGMQKEVVAKHGDKLVGKILNMALEVEVPEEVIAKAKEDQSIQYYWYRAHYWDHVDFEDPRLVRDQMFHRLIDKYYSKVLPQIPDSLSAEAIKLVERTKNKDMFKYIVHHITYASETSKIMCMDKVFVTMVEKYYKTGQAEWLSDEQLEKVIESSDKKKNVLCGEPVTNVILPDTSLTNWVNLYEIDAKYTVIAIWESTCGHCKKEMPKLIEVYDKWKEKGLEVVALGNDFETEPWIEFIDEYQLDWINISDNPAINQADSAAKLIRAGITTLPSLNFRTTFDVFSTPKIFLLDEDKVILAKQLSAEQLDELLTRFEEGESEAPIEEDSELEMDPNRDAMENKNEGKDKKKGKKRAKASK